MLNRILNSQVDNRDEIAKEMNLIIEAVNHNTIAGEEVALETIKLDKKIQARPTQNWVKKLLTPMTPKSKAKAKAKAKGKGNVLTKTLVSMVILVLLCGLCLGQDEWPITYDTVSTPNQLVQLLRNRFSNQSGNYFTFGPTTTAPPHSKGRMYYHTTNGLYISDGTSWEAVDTAGGLSLDGAYDKGNMITVDGSAVTLTAGSSDDNEVLILVQSSTGAYAGLTITNAGTDPSIEIDGSGTGDDITGTNDYWTVSEAGIGTFIGLITGTSNIVMRNSETIDNNDDGEITFSDGSLDTAISWSGTTLQWTTDTSIDTVAWGNLDAHTGLTNITGDATDFTISHTGNVTGYDLLITQFGSGDNALTLTSDGTASDAIGLVSSAGITLTSTVEPSVWTQTATGDADDLTISVAGTHDSSLILSSAGTGADALSIFTSHANGDIKILSTDTIDIDATDHVTIDISGAAADFDVDSAAGSISLDGGETASDAVVIIASATAGGIDIDSGTAGIAVDTTGGIDINSFQMFTVDVLGGTAGTADITLTNGVGTDAASIALQSTLGGVLIEAKDDMIFTLATTTQNDNLTIQTSGADDSHIQVLADGTSVNALTLDATAGGVTIDGALSVVITSSEAQADALQLITDNGGGIVITSGSGTITFSDDDISNVGTLACDEITTDADSAISYQMKTVTVQIHHVGGDGDLQWSTGAGHAIQNLDLTAIVPAYARVLDVTVICTESVIGQSNVLLTVGNQSAGAEFIAQADCDTLNGAISSAAGGASFVAINTSASKVWVSADPDDGNWTDQSAGQWAVMVTYIDNDAAKDN